MEATRIRSRTEQGLFPFERLSQVYFSNFLARPPVYIHTYIYASNDVTASSLTLTFKNKNLDEVGDEKTRRQRRASGVLHRLRGHRKEGSARQVARRFLGPGGEKDRLFETISLPAPVPVPPAALVIRV